jgi:hypothetical protein
MASNGKVANVVGASKQCLELYIDLFASPLQIVLATAVDKGKRGTLLLVSMDVHGTDVSQTSRSKASSEIAATMRTLCLSTCLPPFANNACHGCRLVQEENSTDGSSIEASQLISSCWASGPMADGTQVIGWQSC